MKKITIIILSALTIFLYAQKLEYSIEKPSQLFVGTPFQVNVEIITTSSDTIYSPPIDTLDVFVLQDEQQLEQAISQEKKKSILQLTFQAFDTGEYTFPELEFTVVSNNKKKILKTDSFQLVVHSILADSSQVIKDITPPKKLKLILRDIVIPILLLIMLIFIISNIYKLLRKNKNDIKNNLDIDNRPAYIKALELLNKLEEKDLLKKGEFLLYYFHLSYILRYFLENNYSFNAVEMTTSEISRNFLPEDKTIKFKV
ncbi:MAG: BatD family protein, partial [Candidatus Cloacimonadota bacterium]|nr:BatD family protein [Candidatus Cloacimonadota bacterium]